MLLRAAREVAMQQSRNHRYGFFEAVEVDRREKSVNVFFFAPPGRHFLQRSLKTKFRWATD